MNVVAPKCSVCGSELILISTVTEQVEGSRFPQTIEVYHCSVKSCQDEKDRQTAKRLKLKEDREVEEGKRAQERLRLREETKAKKEALAA